VGQPRLAHGAGAVSHVAAPSPQLIVLRELR
jgi:hypothetical protein